jgi:hypothetical protein
MAARFQEGRRWFKAGPHGGQVSPGGAGLRLDLMAARFQEGRRWFKAGPHGGQVSGREELV